MSNETALFQRIEDAPDDSFYVEVGGRSARVFKPRNRGKRAANYHVKFYMSGRTVFQSLGVSTKTMAESVAKKKLKAAMDGRWEALEATLLCKAKPVATIGEIINAYTSRIRDFELTIKDRTVSGYVSALRNVLRRVHTGDVERVPASALTEQLVEQFFAGYVREAGEDFLARDQKIRGANATLRNARALFAESAMRCYRGLTLPDLAGFMKARTAENPDIEHGEISSDTLWEIAQAALCLRDQCPALYLAHLCYRHLGMRNDEIENARLEWIERRKSEVWLPNGEKREVAAFMVIKRRTYWIPKRSVGEVPIAPDVLAELDELLQGRAPNDFLIEAATPTARAWLVDRDHADFIRPWVEDHQKRSYELRRWAATVVAQRQGDEYADRFLRHKSRSVAGKHYITQHAPPAPITFADCGL